MNAALHIAVDLEQGEVRLGSERVRLLPVAGDVFCLNDARGPLVRALKFEERSLLLADAGNRDIASLVAEAALVSSGVAPDAVRIAASLALAGGGEEAPPFPECERFVEKQHGWDARRVGETLALVIDKLCSNMDQHDSNGWKQIVFQTSETVNLESLISWMVTNLSERAVASDSTSNATSQTHNKRSRFETQHHSPAHGSIQSVSSVLPVKRAPFRVLALNTDRQIENRSTDTSITANHKEAEIPALVFSKLDEFVTPQSTTRQAPAPATLPTAPQKTEFTTPTIPQSNRVNFSVTETSAPPAKIEPSIAFQPVASFPTWQPFATPSPKTQAASEPASTASRALGANTTDSPMSSDWLGELAQLLEDECDLRGIDP